MDEDDSNRERVGPGQVALGVGELLGGRALLGNPPELALDHLERLADRLVLGRHAADEDRPVLVGIEVGMDRIGEAALLAHLFHQPRGEAAAADDVVEHISGDEVGVFPRDAAMAELRHRLRHVHLDDLLRRAERRIGVGHRGELGTSRERAEDMVKRLAERRSVDVADHRDHQLVAGEHAVDIGLQVVVRDGGDRFAACP